MKIKFDITAQELQTVRQVLAAHLSPDCKVWVFGSRAKNSARFNSDLDLALECREKIPAKTLADLKEAFNEAPLAYAVDLVDLRSVEPYFKQIIDGQKVAFPLNAKVPKLRFPGFEGEWEEKRLGEIGKIYQPKTISQSDLQEDGYDVYGANGIIGKYKDFNHELEQIAITCRGSTCGFVNFTKKKSWITGNAMVVNLDRSKFVLKRFAYYQLVFSDLSYLITGSGQPQITGDIKNHKVELPSIPEQQKIADFLTELDNRIDTVTRQLEAARQFKKSLFQQMFV